MSKDYLGFDELDDGYPSIVMEDEFGNKQEYILIASVESGGNNYLLVTESKADDEDDDETEASILKEIWVDSQDDEDDIMYSIIEDNEEFERIAKLFQNSNEDYEIEI